VQHDWHGERRDETQSHENTQVQQPLLDDAGKHLKVRTGSHRVCSKAAAMLL
jgi:hypothetical protein